MLALLVYLDDCLWDFSSVRLGGREQVEGKKMHLSATAKKSYLCKYKNPLPQKTTRLYLHVISQSQSTYNVKWLSTRYGLFCCQWNDRGFNMMEEYKSRTMSCYLTARMGAVLYSLFDHVGLRNIPVECPVVMGYVGCAYLQRDWEMSPVI